MPDHVEQWLAELLRLNDEEEKVTEKQIKIVQAAVEIFAEKGYSATSTSEIAQKAGVAEGTIFRHYKTKQNLLLAIVSPIMEKLVAPFVIRNFQEVLNVQYERFEDFMRAMLINRLAFTRKYAPVLKVMIHEIPFNPDLQAQFMEHVSTNVVERVRRIVVHFQAQGQIIEAPADSIVRMCASTIVGYAVTRYFLAPERDWNDDEEIDLMIRFMMNGLSLNPVR